MNWGEIRKRPPTPAEAENLLTARGAAQQELRRLAQDMTPKVITLSLNVTLPVTRLCRNRCAYCGFRREKGGFLAWRDILPLLLEAQDRGCCEALFMSGERPEEVHPRARAFLSEAGFRSTAEYVTWLCGRTLDETELLPHTNIGVLEAEEMRELREVNASLGLMLEDASPRLLRRGMPHWGCPGKDPKARIRTLREAGRLRIPFTSGLLIGIGQTNAEIVRSLMLLKELQDRFGHIQEIILQRFLPKEGTPMESHPPPPDSLMRNVFSVARLIFGGEMNLQVPPNIETDFEAFLDSGANDLGGISPVTPDYINPEQPWGEKDQIFKRILSKGLTPRLRPPVYREFAKPAFLPPRLLRRTRKCIRRMNRQEGS